MAVSWFGIERLPQQADRRERLGMIGVDLGAVVPNPSGDAEVGFDWPLWISRAMGREDLWFGDEIGGHLWLYADVPEQLSEKETDAYLQGIVDRIRDVIGLRSGASTRSASRTAVGNRERGIGYTLLQGWSRREARDIVYEGVMRVSAQMKAAVAANAAFEGARHSALQDELDQLLRDASIRSVYQPIVRLGDGRVFGYEALTRCPQDSLFDGPLSLFRFAEERGQAFALDRLAREKAIRHCPPLGPMQKIFINVTMGIMNDPHFVSGQTIRWLTERGLHPGQVVFELTERSSIDDFDAAKKILAHYRSQGYEIAIDDAGAGYSSLQSIVELNPDYIKIDRSLVRDADKDDMKKHMLRTFVRFAKKMNIRTVAEGIERPEEMRLLRAMGFDFGQGYWIGRPSEQPVNEKSAGLPIG
ncbi:EAL domain-containing protein [Cohnella sp. GCM10027633]|uniref:EAL domain-containing protein n=1 Tax=unclassified Cohnella TaxID=2636738 RepID=UPI0036271E44